ncbi:MAG TPA: thioesterase family protein [Longimicrobium sp.]|uniref:acyl-CoA thioesterase n=1 Tax=Longimicrobium sp. TaxID=2029185 RepID=UPI002ED84956
MTDVSSSGAPHSTEWSEAERRLRAEFPMVVEWPVAWAEMDYFRHVNHAVFFTWFEGARIAYLERIGFRELTAEQQVGPILGSTQARYRRPVFYPDTVVIGARVTEVGPDRFTQEYRIVSRAQGEVAAEGGGTLVAYDYAAGRKVPLPERVRDAIRALEASVRAG